MNGKKGLPAWNKYYINTNRHSVKTPQWFKILNGSILNLNNNGTLIS